MVRDIESTRGARDIAAETQATDVEITSGGEFEGGERETEESLWAMAIGKAVLPAEESLLDGTRRVRPTAQRL